MDYAINGIGTISYPVGTSEIGSLPHILNKSISGELKV